MPIENIRFDYHKYSDYLKCPRRFKWNYDRREPSTKDNKYFSLQGTLIQHFFENYSNFWHKENPRMDYFEIAELIEPKWKKMLAREYVDWNFYGAKKDAHGLFHEAVQIIQAIVCDDEKHPFFHRFKSEVKVEAKMKNGATLVGSMDFVDESEDEIVDGKSTGTLGKNISREQLLMYAVLYHVVHKRYPKKLGFYYYRFRHVVYEKFTEKDILDFRNKYLLTLKTAANDVEYKPTPSAKNCEYCKYMNDCPEGKASADSRKRKKKPLKLTNDGKTTFAGL